MLAAAVGVGGSPDSLVVLVLALVLVLLVLSAGLEVPGLLLPAGLRVASSSSGGGGGGVGTRGGPGIDVSPAVDGCAVPADREPKPACAV